MTEIRKTQARRFAANIVKTKTRPPAARSGIVERVRLLGALERLPNQRLTMLVAPAGFGKTTLLQQLRNQFLSSGGSVAWLRLESSENDARYAAAYLATACGVLDKQISASVAPFFITTTHLSVDEMLADLINAISALQQKVLIVIDDYENIHDSEVHDFFFNVVQHLPDNAQCVVGSREMPPWPLGKFKLQGEVNLVSADALRFTIEETQNFLEGVSQFELPPDEIKALNEKTEGWVAALQLVGLSLKTKAGVAQLVDILRGSQHILFDYLADTVLSQQNDETRRFLVSTSCLDRLSADLCDAVTGKNNGRKMLRMLEESSLFLAPLDEDHEWFRYHPLFIEFLRDRLGGDNEESRRSTCRQASRWFEQQELSVEAVEYAIAAQDFDRAAALMETVAYEAICSSQMDLLSSWINRLPDSFLKTHPSASLFCTWASFLTGQQDDIQKKLAELNVMIEELMDDPDPKRQREGRRWRDFLVLLSKIWPSPQTDKQYDIDSIRDLRAKQSPENHLLLGLIDIALAKWFLQIGNLGHAHTSFLGAQTQSTQAGNFHAAVQAACGAALVRFLQGRLADAIQSCEESLTFAKDESGDLLPVAAVPSLRLAEIFYEINDIEVAKGHLETAISLSGRLNDPSVSRKVELVTTRIINAEEGPVSALKHLRRVEHRVLKGVDKRKLRRLYALQIWLLCQVNDLAAAEALLRALDLPVESRTPNPADKIPYWDEELYLSLARFWIGRGRTGTAIRWLRKLLRAAEFDQRRLSSVLILGLLAIAYDSAGKNPEAMRAMREMLLSGEKYGYIRSIIDMEPAIIPLLAKYRSYHQAQQNETGTSSGLDYINRLISKEKPDAGAAIAAPVSSGTSISTDVDLLDQLTKRESEVLELIALGMSNRAIAGQLVVAETTLKWHVRNLYTKLHVKSRTQAVAKARKLGLIG
ncbi:MAG: AAA family ATPase [Deltaproteobacteria bacterium]|nr:AAA family ATPase [Deltaproteobacteria bacterium]